MKHITSIVTGASLLLAAGCAEPPGHYTTYQNPGYTGQVISSAPDSTVNPVVTTQGSSANDNALAGQIRQNLDSNTLSGVSRGVNINVNNGEVTLTGSVPNDQERRQVDEVVRNTTGVTSVYDQMQIVPNPSVSAYAPVYNGAPNAAPPTGREDQRMIYGNTMATGDIFNLHVQGLNDTDRNLAERILHGLRTDTTLIALLPVVNIHVVNGRVVLRGTVQNEQQRETIASVVERAAGPGNVDNELQVAR